MAKGKSIILTVEPKGVFKEGVSDGAILPGVCCQVKAATEPIGGRPTWQVFDGAADGERTLIAVSYNSGLLGDTNVTATTDGQRVFLYCPCPGDEMNVLVQASAGALAIGDKLILDDTTGKLIKTTGTPESEPFIVLETSADVASDRLVHVMFTGV